MNETKGGFTGDPASALSVVGTGSCCGNPPSATLDLPTVATEGTCCGTAAEATASGQCCGSTAKTEAIASGAGCCG